MSTIVMTLIVVLLCCCCCFLPNDAANFCKNFKTLKPGSPSGVYKVITISGRTIDVYCEMGLNGGGYMFLEPKSLAWLNDDDLSSMFTDSSSFLLRVQITNGSQSYAVLKQLSTYSRFPLKLSLNTNEGYTVPSNIYVIGQPFLFFGFLPKNFSETVNVQGLQVNGVDLTYNHCGVGEASHFALFPNFLEVPPSSAYHPGPVNEGLVANLRLNPSGRVMPPDYFLFGEIHFAGCGCFVQTHQIPGVLGFAIGFR